MLQMFQCSAGEAGSFGNMACSCGAVVISRMFQVNMSMVCPKTVPYSGLFVFHVLDVPQLLETLSVICSTPGVLKVMPFAGMV